MSMNFAEVLTKSFLLSYDGRINRQRYWAFVLVYLAVVIVAAIIDGILGIQFVVLLVVLASIYPSICVTIKRWHDRDKRSEEHTSELQSLMRISYAVFCLKKKKTTINQTYNNVRINQTNYQVLHNN